MKYSTFKGLLIGIILCVAYSSMVLDIIQILKVHRNEYRTTYPPAVVAMLVASILQFVWCCFYLVVRGKGAAMKASAVAGATLFFFLFQTGAVAAATALRNEDRYCPDSASNVGDCRGVFRGTMGLGWSLVGLDLIYLAYLAVLVKRYGNWGHQMWELPNPHRDQDLDKAPTH